MVVPALLPALFVLAGDDRRSPVAGGMLSAIIVTGLFVAIAMTPMRGALGTMQKSRAEELGRQKAQYSPMPLRSWAGDNVGDLP